MRVARSVGGEAREVVVGIGGGGGTVLRATAVAGEPGLGVEVGPGVVGKLVSPAVGAGSGGCLRRGDAVELVVGETLTAAGIEIVGDAVNVSGVFQRYGVDEIVSDVDGCQL